MIVEKNVSAFNQHLYCDKCNTEMKYTGVSFLVNPALHEHECPQCGYIEKCTTIYPAVVIKEIAIPKSPSGCRCGGGKSS